MNGAFYIGALGLDAQQHALDVVANNIANINTTGFKRQVARFSELVSPASDSMDPSTQTSIDLSSGVAGVMVSSTPRVWSEGPLNATGQAFDLAINGAGFLEVLGPSGKELLWRGGTFQVNADGNLATPDGLPLRPMISVPQSATNLSIGGDGVVSAMVDGTPRQLGRLDLALVKQPDALVDAGGGYFELRDPAGMITVQPGQDGGGVLAQGALEGANVDLNTEMITLLLLQRAYTANAQVVQAGDQLMTVVNELRR